MNHVMVMKCLEFFLLHTGSSVFINFIYIHRLHQLKHKFKSIIYNRSGYEASFLIVSKQIYIVSHLKNTGAELEPVILKMLEQSWAELELEPFIFKDAGAELELEP